MQNRFGAQNFPARNRLVGRRNQRWNLRPCVIFIGPQKLGFRIFKIYFNIFMLFKAVLLRLKGNFIFLQTAETRPQILGFGRRF